MRDAGKYTVRLYLFLIRVCVGVIGMLLHRKSRCVKLRRGVFPFWVSYILFVDTCLCMNPPWKPPWSLPNLLGVKDEDFSDDSIDLSRSLVVSVSLHMPILWWLHLMESKKRGVSLLLCTVMTFQRSTIATLLSKSCPLCWMQVGASLLYVWATLTANRQSAQRDTTKHIPQIV